MTGLQVGQALRCIRYLGLGSGVRAPIFLGTQPPYATKALTNRKQIVAIYIYLQTKC